MGEPDPSQRPNNDDDSNSIDSEDVDEQDAKLNYYRAGNG